MTARAPGKGWPEYIAMAGPLAFVIFIPVMAFGGVFTSASFMGSIQSPQAVQAQFWWSVAGAISGGLALVCAGFAAASGGRAAKVIAGITVPFALVVLGVFSLLTSSPAESLPQPPPDAQQQYPDCGPDSRPPVYGGDIRYVPCNDDLALARELVPTITAALPTGGVTPASVDTVAARFTEDGITGYEGAVAFDDGGLVAAWMAAPVTCVVAVWNDGAWQISVDGLLVDGGCGLPGNNSASAQDQRGGGER